MNVYTFNVVDMLGGTVTVETVEANCLTAAWLTALNNHGGPRECRAVLVDYAPLMEVAA